MISESGDELKFRTGKSVGINAGRIGIGTDLNVSYGYDGAVHNFDPYYDWLQLTKAEQIELAEYMLGLWAAYLARANTLP